MLIIEKIYKSTEEELAELKRNEKKNLLRKAKNLKNKTIEQYLGNKRVDLSHILELHKYKDLLKPLNFTTKIHKQKTLDMF